jgi:hypothetical protein
MVVWGGQKAGAHMGRMGGYGFSLFSPFSGFSPFLKPFEESSLI